MMVQRNFLTRLSLLVIVLLISGCSTFRKEPEPEIVTITKVVERNIPLQASPRPMNMQNVNWHVVTEENFEEFLNNYKKENGSAWVFYAVSVRGYEGLTLNMADIKRYIEQQKTIIIYYEDAIKPREEELGDGTLQ